MGTLPKPQEQQPQNANQQGQQSGQKAFKTAPMLEGRIYRAMSQFRAALSRDEEAAILELAAAYNRVDRALQDRLADVLDQLEAMPESEHLGFLSVRLNDLLAQVEGQLSDLSDRAAAIVESGQRATIETTTRHTPRIVRAAGGTNPFNALPTDAFENIVGMAGNGSPLASVLAEAAGAFVSEIRAELVSGVAQGINPQEVAARMVALSGGNRARLETICRTEMIRASREASRRTYAANSDIIDGYIRLSAADTRTCAACWALHGKLYPVDERMPLHPNCRCALVPHLKEGGVQVEEGASLFARLGEEQQKEILGPGRFDLWQSGASLSDFITLSNSPEWGPTVSVSPIAAASARAGVFS
jgi:SPP1 gp7 family putative phage head morphogenesis protein